ncbi:outer membrane autotransporter protein [Silvimonas terrae]|uniref:Outer membrane autotransporter protein n=1 Tax=Silvimonas terrae TaxID=300266 RepID=A0A840RAG7_9NEIS|nr:outer membrane autotransporter protein [Silvimonas terrae]
MLDTALTSVNGNLDTTVASLSLEVGKRIYQDAISREGWFVELQAQISYLRQGGGNFAASNGLNGDIEADSSTQGRLGFVAGREIHNSDKPVQMYGKLSYIKELNGDMTFRLNGTPVTESIGSAWWSYGAGVAAQLGKSVGLYADVTQATGASFTQQWQANIGMNGRFRVELRRGRPISGSYRKGG